MPIRHVNGRVVRMSSELAPLYDRVRQGARLSAAENLKFATWVSGQMSLRDPKGVLEAAIAVRQRMAVVFPNYRPAAQPGTFN